MAAVTTECSRVTETERPLMFVLFAHVTIGFVFDPQICT
jgi:hypothetical protein